MTGTAYFVADGDVTKNLDGPSRFHSDGSGQSTCSAHVVRRDQPAPPEAGPRRDLLGSLARPDQLPEDCSATLEIRCRPQLVDVPDIFLATAWPASTPSAPIGELWYRKSGTYRNKVRI